MHFLLADIVSVYSSLEPKQKKSKVQMLLIWKVHLGSLAIDCLNADKVSSGFIILWNKYLKDLHHTFRILESLA